MAENEDGQEKSEQPTAKRLDDARKKGQIARSRELNTMAITLIGGTALVAMSGQFANDLGQIMHANLTLARSDLFDPNAMMRHLVAAIRDALIMLAPFFAVVITIAVLSSIALGGISMSGEALVPKFDKINPLKGLKRLFSVKGLVELVKAMAKFFLVGGATALVLWLTLDEFVGLSRMPLHPAVTELVRLIGWAFVLISSTLILVALVDVPFQIWDNRRQLKMTRQEIKDEMKETEGRPEVRSRIRSLQREMAMQRMMEEVPKADVVVTNPTHYAVALRYDQNRMRAPKLVAKGVNLVAANIRAVAAENEVPVVESPMLARAIYFHTDLDAYIPAGLYLAVARLLAYVFQLRTQGDQGYETPQPPTDLDIPEDLQVPGEDE